MYGTLGGGGGGRGVGEDEEKALQQQQQQRRQQHQHRGGEGVKRRWGSTALDERFRLTERETSVWTEIRAGTASFLTMSYIIIVNARVLGYPNSGIPRSDVMVGTATSSAVACFVSGYFANLPFALAPGLGLSAYASIGMAGSDPDAWRAALASFFLAGAVQMLLAVSQFSPSLMKNTPRSVQSGTVMGMGLLLAFVGLQEIGLIEGAPQSSGLVQLGQKAYTMEALFAFLGLVLLALLAHRKFPGAILVTLAGMTVVDSQWLNPQNYSGFSPANITADFYLPQESAALFALDFSRLTLPLHGPATFAFVLVGVFDVAGVLMGLSRSAGLATRSSPGPRQSSDSINPDSRRVIRVGEADLGGGGSGTMEEDDEGVAAGEEEDDTPLGAEYCFFAAGLGTCVGACLGSSPVIVHLESAAGLSEGGRTGLTAIVTGAWFALALFAAPLLDQISSLATSPVLVLIGSLMMSQSRHVDWDDPKQSVPAFVTLCVIPFTFSVPNGVAFGAMTAYALEGLDRVLDVCLRKRIKRARA